ncbi:MAG: hypothetical protein ACJA0H_000118 [Francisellaceae bacterium]|jgi:uncharacterized protein (DUF2147 family)
MKNYNIADLKKQTLRLAKKVSTGVALTCLTLGIAYAEQQPCCQANGFEGYWISPTDDIIQVKACEGGIAICAYIAWTEDDGFDEANPDESLRNRRICGLEILKLKAFDDGVWKKGTVYDPLLGMEYKATLKLKEGELYVRGYIVAEVFGETEVWSPVKNFNKTCES